MADMYPNKVCHTPSHICDSHIFLIVYGFYNIEMIVFQRRFLSLDCEMLCLMIHPVRRHSRSSVTDERRKLAINLIRNDHDQWHIEEGVQQPSQFSNVMHQYLSNGLIIIWQVWPLYLLHTVQMNAIRPQILVAPVVYMMLEPQVPNLICALPALVGMCTMTYLLEPVTINR